MKKHWRYLIARWGAYPVVWCLAGEGTMPYYLSKTPKEDADTQKHGPKNFIALRASALLSQLHRTRITQSSTRPPVGSVFGMP